MKIDQANQNDIPELLKVINSAYRGEGSKNGWTTEADLLLGDARIDSESLKDLILERNSVILKCIDDNNKICGCVYLQKQENNLYLGLLSVSPQLQGSGIGKELLNAAVNRAFIQNCSAIKLTVISLRDELIKWYERHGFSKTGEKKPFPRDDRFGIPTRDFDLLVMEKSISVKKA